MYTEYSQAIQHQFGDKYVNPEFLGKGTYAKVFKCKMQQKFVAIKVVNFLYQKQGVVTCLKNEVQLLNQSQNDNVIKLYESQESQAKLFLVLEYCQMDLKHMMINYFDNKLPDELVIIILKQLVNGLHYLHKNNIIHRDLKLENIGVVISKEDFKQLEISNKSQIQYIFQNASYKLLDLGLAKKFIDQTTTKTLAGTLLNMAPEVLERKKYSFEADIYSLGVCLYQMLTGSFPYDTGYYNCDIKDQLNLIKKQNAQFQGIQNSNLRDTVQNMLNYNVQDRLTFLKLYQSKLLFNNKEKTQQKLEKSLIENSQFYIDNDSVQFMSNFSDVSIINPSTSIVKTEVNIIQSNKSQDKSNLLYQDDSFEVNMTQSFDEIQKSSLFKSQIGKPKSMLQEDIQLQNLIRKLNIQRCQCQLIVRLSERLLDFILIMLNEKESYIIKAQFQEYLQYFSNLLQKMIKTLIFEVSQQILAYPSIQELKDFQDSLLNFKVENFTDIIHFTFLEKGIFFMAKLSQQVLQLNKIEEINNSKELLLLNNIIIYQEILKFQEQNQFKDEKLNCKIFSTLIDLCLLTATYKNEFILIDDEIEKYNQDSQQNHCQLQLFKILDKYQLNFYQIFQEK